MRLFLLPLSTRRAFVYCDKHFRKPAAAKLLAAGPTSPDEKQAAPAATESTSDPSPASGPSTTAPQEPLLQRYIDKATDKAATLWSGWERADGGWKKQLTVYGNAALRRIPYEEWGLKSFPPLRQNQADAIRQNLETKPVDVLFPPSLIADDKVDSTLLTLAQERQNMHRQRMWYCLIGAPLTLPFALVPIIPNIPGFYLVFRAWSHYRALYGARYLEFLVQRQLYKSCPSEQLDQIYANARLSTGPKAAASEDTAAAQTANHAESSERETVLLSKDAGHDVAQAFGVNELGVELERAVEQVERALAKPENEAGKPADGTATKDGKS